jgi:hypothetical protein
VSWWRTLGLIWLMFVMMNLLAAVAPPAITSTATIAAAMVMPDLRTTSRPFPIMGILMS